MSSNNSTPNSSEPRPILRRKRSSFSDIVKIVLLGGEGVGKSAITVRFLTKRFIGEYDQTIENKYRHNTMIDNETVLIEVIDTCSKPESLSIKEDNIRWGDAFMIIYSITGRKGFDQVNEFRKKIQEIKKSSQGIPIMALANKADLGHARQVTTAEGEKLATEAGCLFSEVSASEDPESIYEAFYELCREVIATRRRSRTFLDRVFGLNSYKK
ncbi:ras-related and estrogen-regulated growth inhibitor-like [Lineus longissimus]|uniref:ras-related and estrogen-regulated growth inhibitor-like n=1 Tax=Lineus longissimus TaxID=88925 RepID=UPI002B4CFDA3